MKLRILLIAAMALTIHYPQNALAQCANMGFVNLTTVNDTQPDIKSNLVLTFEPSWTIGKGDICGKMYVYGYGETYNITGYDYMNTIAQVWVDGEEVLYEIKTLFGNNQQTPYFDYAIQLKNGTHEYRYKFRTRLIGGTGSYDENTVEKIRYISYNAPPPTVTITTPTDSSVVNEQFQIQATITEPESGINMAKAKVIYANESCPTTGWVLPNESSTYYMQFDMTQHLTGYDLIDGMNYKVCVTGEAISGISSTAYVTVTYQASGGGGGGGTNQSTFNAWGYVYESNTTTPIRGVLVQGGGQITTTDQQGLFILTLEDGNYTLKFSKTGYVTTQLMAGTNTSYPMTIQLTKTVTATAEDLKEYTDEEIKSMLRIWIPILFQLAVLGLIITIVIRSTK